MPRSQFQKQLVLPLIAAAVFAALLFLVVPLFAPLSLSAEQFQSLPADQKAQQEMAQATSEWVGRLLKIALLLSLMFALVRVVSHLIFVTLFRARKGKEAPSLVRDIFSLVAYILFTTLI
ncbi:MAG: hypothetical protein H0T45_08420, partial [Pyrinomonadaceae bacterium]|nr:hypothetical protein [Pyrinomonadaceae bacterium]